MINLLKRLLPRQYWVSAVDIDGPAFHGACVVTARNAEDAVRAAAKYLVTPDAPLHLELAVVEDDTTPSRYRDHLLSAEELTELGARRYGDMLAEREATDAAAAEDPAPSN